MNRFNLSPEQHDLLIEFRDSHTERPTIEQYEAFQKRMGKVTQKKKPKPKSIPNTKPGYHSTDVKLEESFDALKDLPVGWAVHSRFDSGSNFGIISAGQLALIELWNYWYHPLKTSLALLAEAPATKM